MKKIKIIGCEEALKHLLTYLDEELGAGKTREVGHHLDLCRACFSRAEFEKGLKTKLKESGEGTVRPGFERRIRALLAEF